MTNTPIFLRTSQPSNGRLAGSLVLNNIKLTNVPTAVGVAGGAVVLNGGTTTIDHWVQGNVYTGSNLANRFVQSTMPGPTKAASLLDSSGRIFGRTHPQYADYAVDQFVSIRSLGAKGDGTTDDTQAIKNALAQVFMIYITKIKITEIFASSLGAKLSSLTTVPTASHQQSPFLLAHKLSERYGRSSWAMDRPSRT